MCDMGKRAVLRRRVAALLGLTLCVPALCGASFREATEELACVAHAYATQRAVAQSVLRDGMWWGIDAGKRVFESELREYALGRVVSLSYTSQESMVFDGWVAYDDLDGTEASPDGLLTQWAEGYYVTHDWSEYGQQILSMVPGDQVVINGVPIDVVEIFDYPKEAYLRELRAVVDEGRVILQTCEPGEDLNRIVVGIPVTG